MFKDIHLSEGRINFVFANAGIGSALDFYETKDEIAPPPKPNTSAIDVNLNRVCYTNYLAVHYFKLQKLEDASIVITASDASLYPVIFAPLYRAAKRMSVLLSLLIMIFTQKKLQFILIIAKFRRFTRLFASDRPCNDRSQDQSQCHMSWNCPDTNIAARDTQNITRGNVDTSISCGKSSARSFGREEDDGRSRNEGSCRQIVRPGRRAQR